MHENEENLLTKFQNQERSINQLMNRAQTQMVGEKGNFMKNNNYKSEKAHSDLSVEEDQIQSEQAIAGIGSQSSGGDEEDGGEDNEATEITMQRRQQQEEIPDLEKLKHNVATRKSSK